MCVCARYCTLDLCEGRLDCRKHNGSVMTIASEKDKEIKRKEEKDRQHVEK